MRNMPINHMPINHKITLLNHNIRDRHLHNIRFTFYLLLLLLLNMGEMRSVNQMKELFAGKNQFDVMKQMGILRSKFDADWRKLFV